MIISIQLICILNILYKNFSMILANILSLKKKLLKLRHVAQLGNLINSILEKNDVLKLLLYFIHSNGFNHGFLRRSRVLKVQLLTLFTTISWITFHQSFEDRNSSWYLVRSYEWTACWWSRSIMLISILKHYMIDCFDQGFSKWVFMHKKSLGNHCFRQ